MTAVAPHSLFLRGMAGEGAAPERKNAAFPGHSLPEVKIAQ